MTSRSGDYSADDIAAAMRAVGVIPGATIFSHLALGSLGLPVGMRTRDGIFRTVHEGIRRAIGENGTLVVPTYTYSFPRGERYDPTATPSTVGPFTDWFWRQPNVIRSIDPIFSVAAEGPAASRLISDLPPTSFGHDCIYERLLNMNGWLVNLGVDFSTVSFVHWVEWVLKAPYRYDKSFTGQIFDGGRWRETTWTFFVRHLCPNAVPTLSRFVRTGQERGLYRTFPVGRDAVFAMSCHDAMQFVCSEFSQDPWFLAAGPPIPLSPEE